MRSLPPPWKVFFSLYGGSFCYFFFMWEPSATFISLCISLYVLGLQIMLCPPPSPGRKNVRKRPSHGIKIAKKFRVNSKIEKKRNNACALVKKRLLRLLMLRMRISQKTAFTPFVPQKNRMKRTTFTSFVLIHKFWRSEHVE